MNRYVALGLMAAGWMCWLSAEGGASGSGAPSDLTTALNASSPHAALGDQAQVLSRLVGSWDVEYKDFAKDGTVTRRTGEFIMGWIMDGQAVQDLWIVHPSGTRKAREVYTDLHWYDAKSRTWHATFVDPEHGSLAKFKGGPVGNDRYVLETSDLGSKQTRWSFNDIRPDAFVWRDEASSDGGKTWTLQSEYQMKRRRAN